MIMRPAVFVEGTWTQNYHDDVTSRVATTSIKTFYNCTKITLYVLVVTKVKDNTMII